MPLSFICRLPKLSISLSRRQIKERGVYGSVNKIRWVLVYGWVDILGVLSEVIGFAFFGWSVVFFGGCVYLLSYASMGLDTTLLKNSWWFRPQSPLLTELYMAIGLGYSILSHSKQYSYFLK